MDAKKGLFENASVQFDEDGFPFPTINEPTEYLLVSIQVFHSYVHRLHLWVRMTLMLPFMISMRKDHHSYLEGEECIQLNQAQL